MSIYYRCDRAELVHSLRMGTLYRILGKSVLDSFTFDFNVDSAVRHAIYGDSPFQWGDPRNELVKAERNEIYKRIAEHGCKENRSTVEIKTAMEEMADDVADDLIARMRERGVRTLDDLYKEAEQIGDDGVNWSNWAY